MQWSGGVDCKIGLEASVSVTYVPLDPYQFSNAVISFLEEGRRGHLHTTFFTKNLIFFLNAGLS